MLIALLSYHSGQYGAVRVEADGAVLLVGGTGFRDGRGVDPGVEPDEHVRVALHGARVGDNAASVLVADEAQWRALTCAAGSAFILLTLWCVWCVWCVRGETAFILGYLFFWR